MTQPHAKTGFLGVRSWGSFNPALSHHDPHRIHRTNIERSIYRDSPGTGFGGVDLPFPYTSPCIKGEGKFYFFFYWDTHFTQAALYATGRPAIARANIENMIWLIRRQGYMPNHVGITNRSQPPYLCPMVQDYFSQPACPDPVGGEFFVNCAEALRQEYHFWTTARHTPTGLQRHGEHETDEGREKFFHNKRVQAQLKSPVTSQAEKITIGGHFLAEAETGWDFNQRFSSRCNDHNAVDLNGLLYGYETYLAQVSQKLGWGDHDLWKKRADTRRERVNALLWNAERGWFFDYDFVNQRQSEVMALAGMLPLYTGLASPEQAQAMVANLPKLERAHGIAVTDERPGCREFQWAYPNAWPPLTAVTVRALDRYGFKADAARLAQKYVTTTEALFARTGQLWEKTDVETGAVAGGEYDAAPMIGWSAGVYVTLRHYLNAARA